VLLRSLCALKLHATGFLVRAASIRRPFSAVPEPSKEKKRWKRISIQDCASVSTISRCSITCGSLPVRTRTCANSLCQHQSALMCAQRFDVSHCASLSRAQRMSNFMPCASMMQFFARSNSCSCKCEAGYGFKVLEDLICDPQEHEILQRHIQYAHNNLTCKEHYSRQSAITDLPTSHYHAR
jgi:hypothetical protein